MKEALVLGIGSRLMMDDGIGIHVVEELKRIKTNPGVRYAVGETDICYCMHQIETASYVIIVDAAYLGGKPGDVSAIPLQQICGSPVQSIFVHDSHFHNEIRLSGKNVEGIFIGVEPFEIDYGINLSPALQERFPEIVNHVGKIINLRNHNYS